MNRAATARRRECLATPDDPTERGVLSDLITYAAVVLDTDDPGPQDEAVRGGFTRRDPQRERIARQDDAAIVDPRGTSGACEPSCGQHRNAAQQLPTIQHQNEAESRR
jgi:hypothetical protein